jgi:hypothetical protein
MIRTSIFCAALLCGTACAADIHYNLKARIEPSAGTVAVEGTIDAPATGKELSFLLHRNFAITRLTINGKPAEFAYRPDGASLFTPASRTVVVPLPDKAARSLLLAIAYHGRLEKLPEWGAAPEGAPAMDDQVNDRLVQLASYSSWYPQIGPFGTRFDTDLEVTLPRGWTAVSGGKFSEPGPALDRAVTHWQVKDNFDIALSASPAFRRTRDGAVEIYATAMPDGMLAKEATSLAAVMTRFSNWLGAGEVPGGVVRHVYAPMTLGQGRAGIARPGLIITSEGRVRQALANNPNYSLFQDVAHEIAHFWWNFGREQGDWINESFAEYFSALAVREFVSAEQFDAELARYRKSVAGLPADAPSLATVAKEGGYTGWIVRYQKGSLMLDDLRRRMGDAEFLAASRDFLSRYKDKGATTADFRAFWSARMNDGSVIDRWLDTNGGVPSPT